MVKILKPLIFVTLYFLLTPSFAQLRADQISLDKQWKFQYGGTEFAEVIGFNDNGWADVSIPHTWNANDVFDDDLSYARGIAWYRTKINISPSQLNKKVYLHFEGVFQVADVYVNGAFVGRHKGGYTAFEFDVTNHIESDQNLIAVKVNNAQDAFIPPLSIGYAGYGGIYRPVTLRFEDLISFEGPYATSGINLSTPSVNNTSAKLIVEANIRNASNDKQDIRIIHQVLDKSKRTIKTLAQDISLGANQTRSVSLNTNVDHPELWSPETPNLYQVVSTLNVNGETVSTVINPLGFRWFSFSPSTGFSLNGSKYILKGTNRHQDMDGKGDALTYEDHERDMKIIKDMGANFLRLAHYPQSPKVLALADSLGLLIWEEIPVVNYMTIAPEFLANAEHMAKEMIHQGYNHPSVIIWGSMNEILLWSKNGYRAQQHDDEKEYVVEVQKYAVKLDSLVRRTDPSRYSVVAMHMSKEYDDFKLSDISQINAYNVYSGWYSGVVNEFGSAMDKMHQSYPNRIIFISEYGAESDGRLNTYHPQRLDHSTQYQRYYHESYLRQFKERPYLAGTAVWNQFDFSQPNIGGTIINVNQKGLATFNRKPKDIYYLYQANWNEKPMIHIASTEWTKRMGSDKEQATVEVYSNLDKISLSLNGKKQKNIKFNDLCKAVYKLPLKYGENFIEARGYAGTELIIDTLTIHLKSKFIDKENFKSFAINIGANTQYLDANGQIWMSDQAYQKGQYGYIGGKPVMMNLKKLIRHTDDVPMYYSSLEAAKAYQIDVPNGTYELTLGFVEPEDAIKNDRVFNVSINDKILITNLDLSAQVGNITAYQKTFNVIAKDNKGINIKFDATRGAAIFSNLKVERIPKTPYLNARD